MKIFRFAFYTLIIWLLTSPLLSQGIIIDHNCTDLSKISDSSIAQVRKLIKLHYAHTSHGQQLIEGMKRLADPSLQVYDPRLKYTFQYNKLPNSPDLCIMDGQLNESYPTPEHYWRKSGIALTRQVLDTYKIINVSMFSWCRELDQYTEADVEEYLKSISKLEEEYPNVIFVYMTANAQAKYYLGYNRYLRNEQIREYCRKNNKILYDFADLDSTFNGEKATFTDKGRVFPVEHSRYVGNECMHTNFLSCETKAKALWWMLAKIVDRMPQFKN
jgi:hypothetical protein